jgi:2-keto-4-pentenoate hydratase/2-oxohepta-3-ene-1,7-dioic acid hydratase in catechol pathway
MLDDVIVDLGSVVPNLLQLLHGGPARLDAVRSLAESSSATRYDRHSVRLLAPLARPGKLLCLAGNYDEHLREGGASVVPKTERNAWLFLKPSTTIIGPNQPVVLPADLSEEIDWECELAVVIGTSAPRLQVRADQALDYVAGYTIFNDVSARSIIHDAGRRDQFRDRFHDWLHGKWFDTFGPMGPWVVTEDEIPDPQALHIELRLNGETRQSASTADMVFTVAELIEFTNRFVTLEPGDVISTGTPSGVGKSTGRFLQPGDVMEAEIEGIGVLSTPVVRGNQG